MKVLIAGGRGFVGTAFGRELRAAGHEVWNLTRTPSTTANDVKWDGCTERGWSHLLNDVDAVINATGYGLEHWPWTAARKRLFLDSRVIPGRTLSTAIVNSRRRPHVFVQISGINYYGLHGDTIADESFGPADDFLARLTVQWEGASQSVEDVGVRRVVARSAIVLDASGGLLPYMALPVRLFVGGRLGVGTQAVPWIHVVDQVGALRFLVEDDRARGPYNLVAPTPTSSTQFMRALAKALHRPFWLTAPAVLLRLILREMSSLVLEGRYTRPGRLLDLGYWFRFASVEAAFEDLFGNQQHPAGALGG